MLAPPLLQKLATLTARYHVIETALAGQPSPPELQTLTAELGKLHPLVQKFHYWRNSIKKEKELAALARAPTVDTAWAQCLTEERQRLTKLIGAEENDLRRQLTAASPAVTHGCFLEIRAATGGEEACLFAADLLRMYVRLAERRGWPHDIVSSAPGESGGYREIIVALRSTGVYDWLRRESGAHRVQRVPHTEAQGRVHTSVATVAVLPAAPPAAAVSLSPADLRIETFRSRGAGGQHVNTTDSAIRITHVPTGTVVECQDGRSQHKNRAHALAVLRARLLARRQRERQENEAATRRSLVGRGARAERIRTYNFPQGRLTDHRLGLSWHKLPALLDGDLDELLTALRVAPETRPARGDR